MPLTDSLKSKISVIFSVRNGLVGYTAKHYDYFSFEAETINRHFTKIRQKSEKDSLLVAKFKYILKILYQMFII